MEQSVIFFGKITELCSTVIARVEANEEHVCFVIDNALEYSQVLGQYVGADQKVLTVICDLKSMSEAATAGGEYFKSPNHHGLLVTGSRPMHPLISKPKSNIKFFQNEIGEDKLYNKIEAFLQLGVFVKDQAEEAKLQEMEQIKSKIRTKNSVIDTKSVQRIERLGYLEPESQSREKVESDSRVVENEINYADFTMDRGPKKAAADIDMFSRKLVNDRDTGFSRRVEEYINDSDPDKYTEEWLGKEPESVEDLLEDEEFFYAPKDDLFKYFILFSEMLGKPSFNQAVMFKLIKMVLGKSFGCTTKFFSILEEQVCRVDESQELSELQQDIAQYPIETPNWSDETFTAEEYAFTMPYYTDSKLYGFGQATFNGVTLTHDDAAQIEAIFTLAKGVFRP